MRAAQLVETSMKKRVAMTMHGQHLIQSYEVGQRSPIKALDTQSKGANRVWAFSTGEDCAGER